MRKKITALAMCLCMSVGMISFQVNAVQTDKINILEKEGDTYTLENYVNSLEEAQSIQRKYFLDGIKKYSITVDSNVDWKRSVEKATFLEKLDGPESRYITGSMQSLFDLSCKEINVNRNGESKYTIIEFDMDDCINSYTTFFSKRAEMLEEKRKLLATMPNLEEMSDYDKVLGILKYMGKVYYDYDAYYAGKTVDDAYTALVKGKATCVGFTNAFCYLAEIAGLTCKGEMGETSKDNHAWVAVKICGNWYELEPQAVLRDGKKPTDYDVNLSMSLFLRGADYSQKVGYYELNSNKFREELPVSKTDYMEYSGHDYSSHDIVWNGSEATFYKKCKVCGEHESNGIRKNERPVYYYLVDREYIGTPCEVEKVSESKCGEATVTKYKASVTVDGKEYTSEHTVIDGECSHVADEKVIKEATCSEEGVVQKTCENCGYVWTESIPVKEHTYETYSESVDTCSEKYDMETVKCSVCGTVKSRTMKMYYASHDYEFKEHKTLPTCTGEGEDVYGCKKCGAEKTESVAALGHGETELRNVRQATCIEDGYTGDLCCKVCGEVVVKGSVIKGVHNLKPEKIEEKDVVENGRKYHVTIWRDRCEICGECFEPYENKEYVCDVETGTAPTTAIRPTTAKKPEKTTCVGKGSIKWAKNVKRGKIKLKLNKVAGAKGYQIRYATNKKFKKAVIRNSRLSYTIRKLKRGKTYYVEARAYVKSGKNKVYGKWSKAKKVKIKK